MYSTASSYQQQAQTPQQLLSPIQQQQLQQQLGQQFSQQQFSQQQLGQQFGQQLSQQLGQPQQMTTTTTTVQEQRSISVPRTTDGSAAAITSYMPGGTTTTTTEYTTTSPSRIAGSMVAGSAYGETSSGYYTASGNRVVYGQERVISVNQRVDESRTQIVSERFIEHTVRVPKKITREDIIEKVIIVPEKVMNEEIIEELATVKERIIEIAKPVIIEKVIEVPEIEYVEKIVEKPEVIVQEKERRVEKLMYEERIREVPKVVQQERIVEIPDIQYRDIPVERIVEVPEIREEVIWRDERVDQHVPTPVPQIEQEEKFVNIERQIPVPIEANTIYEYRLPKMRPRYNKVTYPVYLPRFVEIPIAVELLNAGLISQAEQQIQQINRLKAGVSLCEIENIASQINRADLQNKIPTMDLQTAVLRAWQEGTLQIGAEGGVTTTTTVTTTAASPTSLTVQ